MRAVARSILRDAIARSLTSKPTDPGVGGWTPALWFLANEHGIWLDPSDFTRYMGELGPELLADPEFNNAGNWTTSPPWSVSGGAATHNGSVADYIYTATEAPVVGKWYELTVTVTTVIGVVSVYCGQTPTALNITTAGTHKIAVQCPGTGLKFSLQCSNASGGNTVVTSFSAKELTSINTATLFQNAAGTTPVTAVEQPVGKILDKSGRGNHATQATAASRPVLRLDGANYYFALDRVDDHVTAAAGGGGTTGICVCAAIRTGRAGNALTIWSDRGTNTGYRLSINESNQLVLSAGNGSAHTEVVGPTVTAGTDYVVTGWHDGTNLNVQINAGAATSAAFGTATAGTAGFTIGKDNGAATDYYGDRIYEIVYRKNDTSTSGDRTSLITYMAKQAGITL